VHLLLLLCKSETDTVVLAVEFGVIFADKGITEDPQLASPQWADALDSKLALHSIPGRRLTAEHVKVWPEGVVSATDGESEGRERVRLVTWQDTILSMHDASCVDCINEWLNTVAGTNDDGRPCINHQVALPWGCDTMFADIDIRACNLNLTIDEPVAKFLVQQIQVLVFKVAFPSVQYLVSLPPSVTAEVCFDGSFGSRVLRKKENSSASTLP